MFNSTVRLGGNPTGNLLCRKCRKTDANWIVELRPESEVYFNTLAANQVVASAFPESGHLRYTHECKELTNALQYLHAEESAG